MLKLKLKAAGKPASVGGKQMQRGESRDWEMGITGNGFYQTQKNFDLIYLFCVGEGKPGNLLWCETNKEKRNGGPLGLSGGQIADQYSHSSARLVCPVKDAVGDSQRLLISIPAASEWRGVGRE